MPGNAAASSVQFTNKKLKDELRSDINDMNETVHRDVTIYVEIRAGNLSKRQSHGQSLFIDPILSQSYQPTSNLQTVNIDTGTTDD
ncbi:hypothetical protein WN51_11383 [Melipona quadrifasciata]|uniref:Uncharacterized protein n=1 Tax=Melipona quadrifasciata TaxID=166423 RepID=A0A0M9ABB8_9HYME|nr:hypothetical protein WN51_11383 [Melipona quadrifasciata]